MLLRKDIEMDRRQFLKNTTAALTVAGAGVGPWRSAQAQAGPIKIGLLAPLTGVVASGGKEMVEGVQFYLDQVKGEMGGRKVELVIEDDASNPDTALQKARRLVEQGNCHMLIGNLLANTGLAVANYVKGTGTPYFIPIIAADDLTQRQRIKNVIRVAGYSASEFTHPLGDWALKQGYKKIATISQDYTFGHEQCGGLAQVFTEGGGEIVQQFWHPLNTADFAEGSDNPVTQKFAKEYEAKYGKIPSLYGFSMYSGAMWIDAALKKIGGKVEDREVFIDTVLKTELDGSPLGKAVKLDAYGNPIYDVYIRKVVKRGDGKFWNVPTTSYPNVSQFWKYDPETYMKQPPYSRTFQGIKKG